ncbi:MAG: hypothetical protein OHK0039_49160 [Bacteroidia bacterium]
MSYLPAIAAYIGTQVPVLEIQGHVARYVRLPSGDLSMISGSDKLRLRMGD